MPFGDQKHTKMDHICHQHQLILWDVRQGGLGKHVSHRTCSDRVLTGSYKELTHRDCPHRSSILTHTAASFAAFRRYAISSSRLRAEPQRAHGPQFLSLVRHDMRQGENMSDPDYAPKLRTKIRRLLTPVDGPRMHLP